MNKPKKIKEGGGRAFTLTLRFSAILLLDTFTNINKVIFHARGVVGGKQLGYDCKIKKPLKMK